MSSLEEWWADRRIHSAAPAWQTFLLTRWDRLKNSFLAEAKSHKSFIYLLTNKKKWDDNRGKRSRGADVMEVLTLTNCSTVTRWILSRNIRGGVRSGSGQKDDLWIHTELLFYLLENCLLLKHRDDLSRRLIFFYLLFPLGMIRLVTWWGYKKKKKNRSSALVFAFSAVKILVKAPEQIFSVVKQNSFPVFRGKSSGGSSGPTSSVLFHHFLKFLFHNELNEWMFWVFFFFFSWGD